MNRGVNRVYEVITFDFWNTLFHELNPRLTMMIRIEEMRMTLERFGLIRSAAEIENGFVNAWHDARYQQLAMGIEVGPAGHVARLQHWLDLPDHQPLIDAVYNTYVDVVKLDPPALLDGAAEVLPKLAEKYRLAVICNTGAAPGSILREVMDLAGIFQYFTVTVFSDEVGLAKPNPEIFRHTLRQLGTQPERAVHMGDDPLTDVIGSRRAGMKAVWLAPQSSWTVPECTWHIRNWRQLLEIF
ncbi:MAG: HAD family hydrolase [Solirubrobacterales bacterium]